MLTKRRKQENKIVKCITCSVCIVRYHIYVRCSIQKKVGFATLLYVRHMFKRNITLHALSFISLWRQVANCHWLMQLRIRCTIRCTAKPPPPPPPPDLAPIPLSDCVQLYSNGIHKRTISLRFLDIILRVLRLKDSLYNVYITNQKPKSWLYITISLRFLGIILRVLRLEVSVYNVYITNQFQTSLGGVGG